MKNLKNNLSRDVILARMNGTLTKREYNYLNGSNTYDTNKENEIKKNNKLASITYTEINDLITTFTNLADIVAGKLVSVDNVPKRVGGTIDTLSDLAQQFPYKYYKYPNPRFNEMRKTMDKSKILDYLKIITDNYDTIKKITDDIIEKANRVRYIYYYYYIGDWTNYFTSTTRPNNNIYTDLYSKLTEQLDLISDAETKAIDLYSHTKGFLNMKEGTADVYRAYTDALNQNRIFNDYITGEKATNKVSIKLNKEYFKYNCGISDKNIDKKQDIQKD